MEINVPALKARLKELGATDHGEDPLKEIIFEDARGSFALEYKLLRLRQTNKGAVLTYKDQKVRTIDGTIEIETKVGDAQKTQQLLEALGFIAFRQQEKRRHSYTLGPVTVEIDTWPKIPPYVELEGERESELQEAAEKLGLDWSKADTTSARAVIEEHYNIPITKLRYFTFSRIE